MSENGTHKRKNIWGEVTAQISDHLDLASLELQFETQQATKRLVAAAIAFILVLTGFLVLQVAIIAGLMRLGLSLWLSALILGLVYLVGAAGALWGLGRRDKRVGPPFAATQREVHETLRWIQNIFS